MSDRIPSIEIYRDVEIFDAQGPARIADVRRQIDLVVDGQWTAEALAAFSADARNCPEARLLAADTVTAIFATRKYDRQAIPVDLDRLGADVAGLDSRTWRCPLRHGSQLDPAWRHAILREAPLPESRP